MRDLEHVSAYKPAACLVWTERSRGPEKRKANSGARHACSACSLSNWMTTLDGKSLAQGGLLPPGIARFPKQVLSCFYGPYLTSLVLPDLSLCPGTATGMPDLPMASTRATSPVSTVSVDQVDQAGGQFQIRGRPGLHLRSSTTSHALRLCQITPGNYLISLYLVACRVSFVQSCCLNLSQSMERNQHEGEYEIQGIC